jgi:cell division protein FtsB
MLMSRWQNFLAIVAIFFAAGALWPWSGRNRVVCAAVAFAIIIGLLVRRLQEHAASVTSSRATIKDTESRIERIRAERDKRFSRR